MLTTTTCCGRICVVKRWVQQSPTSTLKIQRTQKDALVRRLPAPANASGLDMLLSGIDSIPWSKPVCKKMFAGGKVN